jgi:hypothetical protein
MATFSFTLLFFIVIGFVAALSSPHAARSIHFHRSIAARVNNYTIPNRSSCKNRPSSTSAPPSSTPSPSSTPPSLDPSSSTPPSYIPSSSTPPPFVPSFAPSLPPSSSSTSHTTTSSSAKPQPSSGNGANSNLPASYSGQGTWYSSTYILESSRISPLTLFFFQLALALVVSQITIPITLLPYLSPFSTPGRMSILYSLLSISHFSLKVVIMV